MCLFKQWLRNRIVDNSKSSIYDGCYRPDLSIEDYVDRCMNYLNHEDEILPMVAIYVSRIATYCKIALTEYNVHRVFAMAMLLAQKLFKDYHYSNADCAPVFGLEVRYLNSLELDTLCLLEWDLVVTNEDYDNIIVDIELSMMTDR